MADEAGGKAAEVVPTYTFNNTRRIELLDLTTWLLAIGDQYRRFTGKMVEVAADNYRLYLREARTGSEVWACPIDRTPLIG